MDAEEQRLEVEPVGARDDDLAVEDAALRERGGERRDELREVSVHRLLVAALEQDVAAVAEDERAKPVPLRLEEPSLAVRQRVGGAGQHGLDRRIEGQTDGAIPDRSRAFPLRN